ncbi:MAG: response regulator [Lachnospiraceae bacterium]|nr:response regulator [Lachnospiraceae bacterium]
MADWIIVVDDDISNLKVAGKILSSHNMRVTALNSGQALLDYVRTNGAPDIILLDIKMHVMNGFDTLEKYRILEEELGIPKVPVIFLTADDDSTSERKGFDMGVSDYIRKPFDPDILVRRVENIVSTHGQMVKFEEEATIDKLTGFLNKSTVNDRISRHCIQEAGCLIIIDLDSFKLVNDIYGHETGDEVLKAFTQIMKDSLPEGGTFGRIGGDEFLIFTNAVRDEERLKVYSETINNEMVRAANRIMGEKMGIPIGASVGAVMVPEAGRDFAELFHIADRVLYHVKNNGKHGYKLYSTEGDLREDDVPGDMDIKTLSHILEERSMPQSAMWMGREAFGNIYRYMIRYMDRYRGTAYKLLFTARFVHSQLPAAERMEIIEHFRELLQNSLRNSDVMMQIGENHFFLLLPEITEYNVERVIDRIRKSWSAGDYGRLVELLVELGSVDTDLHENPYKEEKKNDWVVVVDDDQANLTLVGRILSKNNMRVTALKSGQALLDFMKDNDPDLVLLDIKMPEMNGFETLGLLREQGGGAFRTPVIFLTADEDEETETKGLALGAMDFIRKPIVPDSLILRVKHTLELVLLQNHLTQEVERKTEENENLTLDIVKALAEAIDAKDTYTKGHSGRVAEYSREIARRFGYSEQKLDEIYMMGLLHDVGKIGVPDAVINKPAKLTDAEFELIKAHPVKGAKILENIKDMPKLADGARWHHERYGGGGYPDGLKGDEIPEVARIIAVADSYDAMTSRRSYRDPLPQGFVRNEILQGSGTQFDPRFADIMISMIDEDKDFDMREK